MTDETPQTENEAAGGQSRAGEAGANLTNVLCKLTPTPDELEVIEDIKAMAEDYGGGMFWKRATARVALGMLRRCYEFA